MKGYTTREVSQILDLSERQVRAYVAAGLIEPQRGERGEFRFSFEDLVFLRAARGLFAARIPGRRLRRALSRLREQLPTGRRLTGMRISVEGKRIVAGDSESRWQPESGQILFDFGVEELARKTAPLTRRAFAEAKEGEEKGETLSAEEWFRWGCELETASPEQARDAYRRALAIDRAHADAHVNLGRLLHEAGDPAAAETHYREALAARPGDGTAAYNLGVALEDRGDSAAALEAYESAVSIDPGNADAHYNAATLCERLGRPADALRHLKVCRDLARGGPGKNPRSS